MVVLQTLHMKVLEAVRARGVADAAGDTGDAVSGTAFKRFEQACCDVCIVASAFTAGECVTAAMLLAYQ